jgi:hypothetical protein
MHTILWLENLKGTDNPEDLGVDGKYLELMLGETGWERVDWTHLDQDQWRALVKTVMNFRVL